MKLRAMNPQPTSATNYDSYVWPRSKTPAKDALYLLLHDLGWRYDAASVTFHTPEGQRPDLGTLEYDPDFAWARIQPPSQPDDTLDPPWRRPDPLLELVRIDGGVWEVAS